MHISARWSVPGAADVSPDLRRNKISIYVVNSPRAGLTQLSRWRWETRDVPVFSEMNSRTSRLLLFIKKNVPGVLNIWGVIFYH